MPRWHSACESYGEPLLANPARSLPESRMTLTAPPAAGQSLIIDAVTHRYGAAFAVDNVTLDIKAVESSEESGDLTGPARAPLTWISSTRW